MAASGCLEEFGVFRARAINGVKENMNIEKSIDRLRVEIADLDKAIAIFEKLSGRLTALTCAAAPNKTNPTEGRRKKSRLNSHGNLRLLA